ncbi:hypothetical protein ERO13_D06G138466v2 [Gossypium hirsutum]|nr:hypothetical protein ERO13_D06G138466v2 [Gossypium hirsutum]
MALTPDHGGRKIKKKILVFFDSPDKKKRRLSLKMTNLSLHDGAKRGKVLRPWKRRTCAEEAATVKACSD